MDFNAFIQWAFLGLVSGGVVILWQMKNSVNELNTKLAVMIVTIDFHSKEIQKIDSRIEKLEERSIC